QPHLDDLPIFIDDLRAKLDFRGQRGGLREPHTAKIDQELEIARQAVDFSPDAAITGILEALDDPRLKKLRQAIAPLHVGEGLTVDGSRAHKNLLRIEEENRGGLLDDELRSRYLFERCKIGRRRQIVD